MRARNVVKLATASMKNSNLINWVCADAMSDRAEPKRIFEQKRLTAVETDPNTLLLGDGNVIGGGGVNSYWNHFIGSSIAARWDETVHGSRGNVALSDGSAQTLTTMALREQISAVLTSGTTNVVISKPQGTL